LYEKGDLVRKGKLADGRREKSLGGVKGTLTIFKLQKRRGGIYRRGGRIDLWFLPETGRRGEKKRKCSKTGGKKKRVRGRKKKGGSFLRFCKRKGGYLPQWNQNAAREEEKKNTNLANPVVEGGKKGLFGRERCAAGWKGPDLNGQNRKKHATPVAVSLWESDTNRDFN